MSQFAPPRNTPNNGRMDARSFVPRRPMEFLHRCAWKRERGTVLLRPKGFHLHEHCLCCVPLPPPCCHDRSHLAANTRYSSSLSPHPHSEPPKHTLRKQLTHSYSLRLFVSLPSSILVWCVWRACVPRFSKHLLKVIIAGRSLGIALYLSIVENFFLHSLYLH